MRARECGTSSGRRERAARICAALCAAGALACATPLACAAPALGAPAAPTASAQPASPATLQVGSQTLTLCGRAPAAYCGTLSVPLDHLAAAGPRIAIAYSFYPASAPAGGHASGTVVPVEGGPGYPSAGSVEYASFPSPLGYAPMYGPLLRGYNMLAVDNRGTGLSVPLDCRALQDFEEGGEPLAAVAAQCAEKLDHRWRSPGGGWVHASDLFTSAAAAQDMAEVIEALGLGKVDLYGDSYGSFFAQVFASRFPRMVRSLVLDSTYETIGLDPWYRSSVAAMPGDFAAACERSPACASAEPLAPWQRIGELAQRLREAPLEGVVPGPEGAMRRVSMGVAGLVNLVSDAAEDTAVYGELDAAARALLIAGDPGPLLRLYAQRLAVDEAYFGLPVREYSVELYLASACLDYPQLFNMAAAPARRTEELAAAEALLPASTFSPFAIAEWLSMDENTEAYTACLDWPSPTIAQPPTSGREPLLASSLPVLVLGGELDSWTPPGDVPKVLAETGGDARFVELANSTHVVGEGDTECGDELVREFVARPRALATLDASCAPAVAPVRSVGVYATSLSEQPPVEPAPGTSPSAQALRLAAAALATAGDALARYRATEASLDHGLHGGAVTASHGARLFTLKNDRLLADVAVSGTVALSPAPIAADGETVIATLTTRSAGIAAGSFTATWTTAGAGALAQIAGAVGREALSGTLPAP